MFMATEAVHDNPCPQDRSTAAVEHRLKAMSVFTCATSYACPARHIRAGQFISLLSNAEALDDGPIPGIIDAAEIIQNPSPPPDQLQQAPPGMVILLVGLEMFGKIRDAVGQHRNLDLRGSGVRVVLPIL
jgi:hypothetical protein